MNIKNIINNPSATIIDVRTEMEFAQEHIEGALNIPLQDIPGRLAEISNLPVPVILYCRSGNRSAQALTFLKQQGLQDLYNGGSLEEMKLYKSAA